MRGGAGEQRTTEGARGVSWFSRKLLPSWLGGPSRKGHLTTTARSKIRSNMLLLSRAYADVKERQRAEWKALQEARSLNGLPAPDWDPTTGPTGLEPKHNGLEVPRAVRSAWEIEEDAGESKRSHTRKPFDSPSRTSELPHSIPAGAGALHSEPPHQRTGVDLGPPMMIVALAKPEEPGATLRPAGTAAEATGPTDSALALPVFRPLTVDEILAEAVRQHLGDDDFSDEGEEGEEEEDEEEDEGASKQRHDTGKGDDECSPGDTRVTVQGGGANLSRTSAQGPEEVQQGDRVDDDHSRKRRRRRRPRRAQNDDPSKAGRRSQRQRMHFADVVELAVEANRRKFTLGALFCPFYMCVGPRLRAALKRLMDHPLYVSVFLLFTLFTVFAEDMRGAFFPKSVDTPFYWTYFASFVVFVSDAIIAVCVDRHIMLEFFWGLDLIAAFLILLDIPVFLASANSIFTGGGVEQSVNIAQSTVHAGTRVTPLLRLLRLVRILKLFRVGRKLRRGVRVTQRWLEPVAVTLDALSTSCKRAGARCIPALAHSIEAEHARQQRRRSSALRTALLLSSKPRPKEMATGHPAGSGLATHEPLPKPTPATEHLEEDFATSPEPAMRPPAARHSTFNPTMLADTSAKSYKHVTNVISPVFSTRKLLETSKPPPRTGKDEPAAPSPKRPIDPEKNDTRGRRRSSTKHRRDSIEDEVDDDGVVVDETIRQAGWINAEEAKGTSRVGQRISQSIKMKVVLGVIVIVLVLPLLTPESTESESRLDWTLQVIEQRNSDPASQGELVTTFLNDTSGVLFLQVPGSTIGNVDTTDPSILVRESERISALRESDVELHRTARGTELWIDVSSQIKSEALSHFLMTHLIILFLTIQALFIQRDVDRLLVWPIERISAYLRPVMDDAIASMATTAQSSANVPGTNQPKKATGWRRILGQDDGEEMSTKLMLAAIECLRRDLSKAARKRFARKAVLSALKNKDRFVEDLQRTLNRLAREGGLTDDGRLRFVPEENDDNVIATLRATKGARGATVLRSRTSVVPYAGLDRVAEAPIEEEDEEDEDEDRVERDRDESDAARDDELSPSTKPKKGKHRKKGARTKGRTRAKIRDERNLTTPMDTVPETETTGQGSPIAAATNPTERSEEEDEQRDP